jgi:2-polyprenyl-6-methoxyphenol hydroxylase-like FAD-dependent oxidoreductase
VRKVCHHKTRRLHDHADTDRYDFAARTDAMTQQRIIIVGGGFGGLAAAKALGKAPAEIILIDRTNHHLFQPLLYQVATSVPAFSQIGFPTRAILRRQKNTTEEKFKKENYRGKKRRDPKYRYRWHRRHRCKLGRLLPV